MIRKEKFHKTQKGVKLEMFCQAKKMCGHSTAKGFFAFFLKGTCWDDAHFLPVSGEQFCLWCHHSNVNQSLDGSRKLAIWRYCFQEHGCKHLG